jgi:hypothetical protein
MKTTRLMSFGILGCLALSSVALASPEIPICDVAKSEVPYSYIVNVNSDDVSSKADLVTALQVFGTGGFAVHGVLNFGNVDSWVFLRFDRNYYPDLAKSEEVLKKGLETLVSLNGVSVRCETLSFPTPALTIRN